MINWLSFGLGINEESAIREVNKIASVLKEVDKKIARITLNGGVMGTTLLPDNSIIIYKGSTKTVQLTIQDENKVPINLTDCRLLLSIKRLDTDQFPLIQKDTNIVSQAEITKPLEGVVRFYFVPSDTLTIDTDDYMFDIWLIDASDSQYPVVPKATFRVLRGVTILN